MAAPDDPIYDPQPSRSDRPAGATPPTPPTDTTPTPPTVQTPTVRQPTVRPGSDGPPQDAPAQDTPATELPGRLKGNSYADIIPQLQEIADRNKPLDDEKLKKLRRRQKAKSVIAAISDAASALANMWAVHNYAPNAYKPEGSMSARLRERFQREAEERRAKDEQYFTALENIAKLRAAGNAEELAAFKTDHDIKSAERAYRDSRTDRAADVKFRQDQFDEAKKQWKQTFDTNNDHWQREYDQKDRQFDVGAAHEASRIALESQRVNLERQRMDLDGSVTFTTAKGDVTLDKRKFNDYQIAYIYAGLPEKVRNQYKGEPIYGEVPDSVNRKKMVKTIVGYKTPDTGTMLSVIGANIDKADANQEVQNRLHEVAGGRLAAPYTKKEKGGDGKKKSSGI